MRADGSGLRMWSQTKFWKLLSPFQAKPPGGGIKCISPYKCVFLLLFAWAIGAIFLKWTENHSSAFFCVVRLANCAVIKQNYPLIG